MKDVIFGFSITPEYKMEILPLTDTQIRQMKWASFKEEVKEMFIFTSLMTGMYSSIGLLFYFIAKGID